MSSDRPVANFKSRIATIGLLILALALLSGMLFGLRHLTRDEPEPSRSAVGRAELAPQQRTAPPPVSQDYVGSTACRECHSDIWDRYQTHPMSQSLGKASEVSLVEDYSPESSFARGGREYYVERQGDSVGHHERQTDEQGEVIYDQAVRVDYAVGSGKRGRSYVIDRGGLLFLSPIAWYSEKQRWDLAPGYPDRGHLRFERRVVDRCISCHSGRVAPDTGRVDHFQEPAIVEFAIGCERCHGPGGEHVAGRRGPNSPAHKDDIVNPARLTSGKRESICNQCHLHGDVEILRYGRRDFDFRPGMHVGEIWSFLLTHADRDSQAPKSVSQVQQMYDSACALRSAGRLTCVSCHDPHFSPAEADKPDFYRQKCLACHAVGDCRELPERRQAPAIADSCVACHMPRLNASDVPHTTQTDHRVPRRPGGAPAKSHAKHEVGDDFVEIFDQAAAPLSVLDESRIRGLVAAKSAEEGRNLRLASRARHYLEPVFRAAPDDYETGDGLAVIRFLERDEDAAVAIWIGLLHVSPVHEQTLQSLLLACRKQGRDVDALGYLDRLLEANPWHAQFWQQRSQLQSTLGRRQEALASGLRALELDPSLQELYQPLAELARSLGKVEQARRLEQTGRRFKPVE